MIPRHPRCFCAAGRALHGKPRLPWRGARATPGANSTSSHDGADCLKWRQGVLDDAMAGVSISTIRLNLNSGALHKWWQFVEGANLHVEAPKQPVQLRSRMEAFVQDNITEPTLRIQLTSGRTDGVLEQTKALDGTEVARAAAEREAAAVSSAAAEDSNETHAAAHEAGAAG